MTNRLGAVFLLQTLLSSVLASSPHVAKARRAGRFLYSKQSEDRVQSPTRPNT